MTDDADDWRRDEYRRAGSALSFPRDRGWHRLLRDGDGPRLTNPSMAEMEWVYFNAHLDEEGARGRRFVVFAAYFTQWLRFLVVRAWDADDRYLGAWTGTSLGWLRAERGRHAIEFRHPGGADRWVEKGGAFDTELFACDDAGGFSVALSMACTRRPYEAGGTGYLPFARDGWFYYYSLTRLDVAGELDLARPDGSRERVKVGGLGWFDHQWGDFAVTPFRLPGFEEYEWGSVQLDSGDDLILTTVWEPHGEAPSLDAFGGVGLVRANGAWERVVGPAYITRTAFWRSEKQHAVYAAGWRVEVPAWGLNVDITPRHDDQLTPIVDDVGASPSLRALRAIFGAAANWLGSFWEGSARVEGTFDGRPVKGVAFMELVKRYREPELRVEVARQGEGFAVVAWRAMRPDPEAPLTYSVTVETRAGEVLREHAKLDGSVLVLDDRELPRGEALVVRVRGAADAAGVLACEATAEVTLR